MDFEIAVVGVGLAGQQAFQFQLGGLLLQRQQGVLGVLDDGFVAFGLAHLDQLDASLSSRSRAR